MINRDENDADGRPDQHEHHPGGMLEPAAVFVRHAHADEGERGAPRVEGQQGGHHVLDPRAGVAARDADQKLEVLEYCGGRFRGGLGGGEVMRCGVGIRLWGSRDCSGQRITEILGVREI